MNEPDKFSLVPRAPGALEKTDAGAKRILSDMIADTLALAKPHRTRPPRIVMFFRYSSVLEILEAMIRPSFKDITILTFTDWELAQQELMREAPDLFTMGTPRHPSDPSGGDEFLRLLTARQVKYPIIVVETYESMLEQLRQGFLGSNLNVTFMLIPFATKQFIMAIEDALQITATVAPVKSDGARPPRIVILDDEESLLTAVTQVIWHSFNDATILTFMDAEKALQELMREAPDLFITDMYHPEPNGGVLLGLLIEKKVKYPVIVMEGYGLVELERLLQGCLGSNLNVLFIQKPFTVKELITTIEKALQISAQHVP